MSKILKLLTLLNLPNIGNVKAKKLLPELEDDSNSRELQLILKTLVNIELSIERIQQAHSNALIIIEECQENNISILTGESIPNQLASFNDTPIIFYVRGNQTLMGEKIVAIVGSRNPTKKGIEAADKISKFIVQTNHIILSGLALGIDSIAHQTAVNNKKPTIAVLGSGLMNIYPKENIELSEQIIDYGGCLISAYSPSMSVQNYQLVARDKLQARLSNNLILIESKINGGSMHATKEAVKLGLPLFSVAYDGEPILNWEGNSSLINSSKANILNFNNLEDDLSTINLNTRLKQSLFD